MKLYNPNFLKNKQRFPIAIVVGLLCSVLCAFIYSAITLLLGMRMSLLYIAGGYGIAYVIKTYGKGVDNRFSILAVVYTLLFVLLADVFSSCIAFGFHFELIPFYLRTFFIRFAQLNVYSIMEVVLIAYSCYVAYDYAKIV